MPIILTKDVSGPCMISILTSVCSQCDLYIIVHQQTETAADDMRKELDMIKNQLSTERNSVRNLESLLSTNREKEFQVQLENQEQRSELQLVKDRLALADSKV